MYKHKDSFIFPGYFIEVYLCYNVRTTGVGHNWIDLVCMHARPSGTRVWPLWIQTWVWENIPILGLQKLSVPDTQLVVRPVTIWWLSGPEQRSWLGEGQAGWKIWCMGPWGQDQWVDLRAWALGCRSEWKHGVSKRRAWQLGKDDGLSLCRKWTGGNGWRAISAQLPLEKWCFECSSHVAADVWKPTSSWLTGVSASPLLQPVESTFWLISSFLPPTFGQFPLAFNDMIEI